MVVCMVLAVLSASPSRTVTHGAAKPLSPLTTGCPVQVLPWDAASSSNPRAPIARYAADRGHYLIRASELASAGITGTTSISALGWRYIDPPGLDATAPLKIYLENTADTTNVKSTNWLTAIGTMTLVHDAGTLLPNSIEPFEITFSGGPFTYTGGGLYVAYDWGPYTGSLATAGLIACNSAGLALRGAAINSAAATLNAVNAFGPETRLTPTTATVFNDASVDFVISPGSLPQPLVGTQTIQAHVTNRGRNALTDLPVTLNITGAETFANTQNVPSLAACGGKTTVSFAPFTPSAIGSDTLVVSVPADDFTLNDSLSKPLDETFNLYSYKRPGSTRRGGFGLPGTTMDVVAKFTTAVAAKISAVNLEFHTATATTYRVEIYPDSGSGTPGLVPIYEDAADRTVSLAGPVTIPLPSPLAVGPGTFFVGVQQSNTTSLSLSFDFENPMRTGVFFFAFPHPAATWLDLSSDDTFRPNIGITLVQCTSAVECDDNNVCTTDACTNQLCVHTGGDCVVAVAPDNDATNVPVSANVSLKYHDVINGATVTPSTFRLIGPGGGSVPAQLSIIGQTPTLNPTAPLDPNTVYTVEATAGILGPGGAPTQPFSISFRTGAAPEASVLPGVSTSTTGPGGHATADCGDKNGDGIRDVCVGDPGHPPPGGGLAPTSADEPGAVSLYFGSANAGERAQPDIIFTGVGLHDRAGVSVAGNFDFNGDGKSDIVIGAEQVDRTTNPTTPIPTGNGKVYVIFFDPADAVHYPNIADPAVPDTVSLSLVGQPGGIPGVVLTGAAFGDQAGFSVAAGGTSTPGGGTDIVVGAPGADPGGRTDAGAAYVVFDSPTLSGDVSLTRISSGLPDQVPGKAFLGSDAGDNLGFSTAFAGPIIQGQSPNTGTVVIGAPGANAKAGKVIVPPEDPDTTPIIVDAIGTTHSGVRIGGAQPGEQLGFAVAAGGDALADGVPDLLIGAPTYDVGGQTDAGRALHTSQVIPTGVYSANAVGATISGVIWTGGAAGDELGYAVAGVSDVTGDGFDDIVLGAPFVDPVVAGTPQTDAGAVYLIDGLPATGTLGSRSVTDVGTTIAGQEFTGTQAGEHAGSAIAGTGDVSGDGTSDFAVGAPGRDAGSGTVYMVLHSTPPPVGECGPAGCTVADLVTGAEIDVPAGGLATTVNIDVKGILDATGLPAPAPAGKMLLAAARFTPDGLSFLAPLATIHLPTGQALTMARAPSEVVPLFYFNGSGWAAAGIDGTMGPNPSYPAQAAVNATGGVLHVYAVFLNDADGDGVRDETDNCPLTQNPNQLDTNHDGIGDACQCLNVNCNDSNPCTSDGCSSVSGCVHTNNTSACDDGNACTVGDTCALGVCNGGATITAPPETGNVSVASDKITYSWSNALYATTYDLVSGTRSSGGLDYSAGNCLSSPVSTAYNDVRPAPSAGSHYWYLVRGRNACGLGTYGTTQRDSGIPACP